MKKKFLFTAVFTALITVLGACSSDDPKDPSNPDQPDPEPEQPALTPGSYGIYVVNSGAMYANKPGSLGYLDYETDVMTPDVFYDVNKMYVGDTFNSGYIFGDQIYLAVTDSRVFHVLDRNSLALVKTVQPDATAGPRHITSYNGYVYCTLYGSPGYLCRINPETFECTLLEVGPQPEYVVPFNGKLYVAVSDGYSTTFDNSCIVVVDPSTFTVTKTITGIKNPVQLATNGSQLFVCTWGEYTADFTVINQGVREIVNDVIGERICQGNYMALDGTSLYVVDATFDAEQFYYWVVDTNSGNKKEWISAADAVFAPMFIAVDPVRHYVVLLSNVEGEYGYPSYTTDGYMNIYNADGSFIGKQTTGVGPCGVIFNVYE